MAGAIRTSRSTEEQVRCAVQQAEAGGGGALPKVRRGPGHVLPRAAEVWRG